jgi:light-regulated signal transduction histidine kinase (bacteriophytochrome)/CheY-like chemotaxis protein
LEDATASETEPTDPIHLDPDYYGLVRKTLTRFQEASSIKTLSQAITEELRRITELDRVMVYYFHADDSGEVIAESKREDQASWLGWRYPAHDIPRPAREIFKKIWSRPVPDVRAELFEMVPLLNPDTRKPLDMTYCSLRGASIMYTEYLDNMGVRAALTLPLMREGELWGLITASLDASGAIVGFVGISRDVTERKKLEQQLLRAQRMESLGTMAGGIAHDLNNVLAPIVMSIGLLKNMVEEPQSKSILETIEASANRGGDIVRQVLSFARGLESDKIEIQPNHLLKELEKTIKNTFPKDIRVQFSITDDTWTILGDPPQVHQVLLNLCLNARDAMPHGGSLTVRIENSVLEERYGAMNLQARAGRYVSVSVTDTGTGMPPNVVDKIFEPFFTTKTLTKGTGLGLSTVLAIVRSHEGIINVYSEPGKGTTLKVYLPAMESSPEIRKEAPTEPNLPRGHGETVLLVDDEASIRTITGQALQTYGYRVLTAIDGVDAVAVYVQHRHEIGVVLIDMNMPGMDGPTAIRALMKINPKIKIIAASGLNANESVAKAAGAGVKHFLTKPYTTETLLTTIRALLDEA